MEEGARVLLETGRRFHMGHPEGCPSLSAATDVSRACLVDMSPGLCLSESHAVPNSYIPRRSRRENRAVDGAKP